MNRTDLNLKTDNSYNVKIKLHCVEIILKKIVLPNFKDHQIFM